MIPEPDWLDPAAVKLYKRKIARRDLLHITAAVLIGLLPAAAFMIYRWFYPEKAEQQRQRVRERIKANLDSPATKGDLLYVMLMLFALGAMALSMLRT